MTNTEDARARLSEEKPRSCPLCGSAEAHVWRTVDDHHGVCCDDCGCEVSSPDRTKAGAIAAWNRRPAPPPPGVERETLTPERAWQELLDKDDRTSPEEYPEMALITADELAGFMRAALPREGVMVDELRRLVLGAVAIYDDSEDWEGPCPRVDIAPQGFARLKDYVGARDFGSIDDIRPELRAALQPPHSDPAGGGEFVRVPREPSQEMRKAALEKWGELLSKRIPVFVAMQDVLRAAIAAAPGDQKCSGPDGPPGLGSTQLRRQSDTSSAPEAEWSSPDLEIHARLAQQGFDNPIAQVAVRAGFLMCREIMARFVEQGGDVSTAASIRANWIPAFGDDPGPPRKYDFAEVAEAEDVENGPWRSKNPGACVDGAVYALEAMHALGIAAPAERDPSAVAPELGSASAEPKASGPLPTDQDTGGER